MANFASISAPPTPATAARLWTAETPAPWPAPASLVWPRWGGSGNPPSRNRLCAPRLPRAGCPASGCRSAAVAVAELAAAAPAAPLSPAPGTPFRARWGRGVGGPLAATVALLHAQQAVVGGALQ